MCNLTVVIFRKDRTGRKECFALFPELPSDPEGLFCTAYQHLGQHCAADYQGCVANSDPASLDEYADLRRELELRGYTLEVRNRATAVMHERRRWVALVWTAKREKRA